ncbi:PQQ-binding-like beta-propeller repeat protein [Haloarchaeobius sp. DYHT-AS-18]|uniref:outer membrane protein assembly factor BamB family protein n=1 Tax=Haloarchaeobius sp. DYHT-AS-18 TaxID=3446117 RepID=UPI003EBBE9F9
MYISSARPDDKGAVTAVDSATGERTWTTELGGFPGALYLESDADTLYVSASNLKTVYLLDLETGEQLASAEIGDTQGAGALADSTFVIGTNSGPGEDTLYGLHSETLAEQWTVSSDLTGFNGAVTTDDAVTAAFRNGRVTGYDPSSGTELWETDATIASPRHGPFSDQKGGVFAVHSSDNQLLRLDPSSGERLWSSQLGTETGRAAAVAPPSFDEGTLYLGADQRVMAVDIESGDSVWTQDIGETVTSSVAIAKDVCWVVSEDSEDETTSLHGFHLDDGTAYYQGVPQAVSDLREASDTDEPLTLRQVSSTGDQLTLTAGKNVVGLRTEQL